MKHIGSQTRETYKEAGYEIVSASDDGEVVLKNEDGGYELWVQNDDFAGYVVEIGGIGYEFITSVEVENHVKN